MVEMARHRPDSNNSLVVSRPFEGPNYGAEGKRGGEKILRGIVKKNATLAGSRGKKFGFNISVDTEVEAAAEEVGPTSGFANLPEMEKLKPSKHVLEFMPLDIQHVERRLKESHEKEMWDELGIRPEGPFCMMPTLQRRQVINQSPLPQPPSRFSEGNASCGSSMHRSSSARSRAPSTTVPSNGLAASSSSQVFPSSSIPQVSKSLPILPSAARLRLMDVISERAAAKCTISQVVLPTPKKKHHLTGVDLIQNALQSVRKAERVLDDLQGNLSNLDSQPVMEVDAMSAKHTGTPSTQSPHVSVQPKRASNQTIAVQIASSRRQKTMLWGNVGNKAKNSSAQAPTEADLYRAASHVQHPDLDDDENGCGMMNKGSMRFVNAMSWKRSTSPKQARIWGKGVALHTEVANFGFLNEMQMNTSLVEAAKQRLEAMEKSLKLFSPEFNASYNRKQSAEREERNGSSFYHGDDGDKALQQALVAAAEAGHDSSFDSKPISRAYSPSRLSRSSYAQEQPSVFAALQDILEGEGEGGRREGGAATATATMGVAVSACSNSSLLPPASASRVIEPQSLVSNAAVLKAEPRNSGTVSSELGVEHGSVTGSGKVHALANGSGEAGALATGSVLEGPPGIALGESLSKSPSLSMRRPPSQVQRQLLEAVMPLSGNVTSVLSPQVSKRLSNQLASHLSQPMPILERHASGGFQDPSSHAGGLANAHPASISKGNAVQADASAQTLDSGAPLSGMFSEPQQQQQLPTTAAYSSWSQGVAGGADHPPVSTGYPSGALGATAAAGEYPSGAQGATAEAGGYLPKLVQPPRRADLKTPDVYSGAFGRLRDYRGRMNNEKKWLMKQNPVAFQEDAAAQAEADYRARAEYAHMKHAVLADGSTVAESAVKDFLTSVKFLQSDRPFFLPPLSEREYVERLPYDPQPQGQTEVVHKWSLANSIFSRRKKENEARDLVDTEKIRSAQFLTDWSRVAAKSHFRKLVGREDKGVSGNNEKLEIEIAEVRQEMEKYKNELRAIFNYYSMVFGPMNSESVMVMGFNTWMTFCAETQMADAVGCKISDLATIFVTVNFEESPDSAESMANEDDAMMRFEFYEGIVRAAFGRFIRSKEMDDASDATERFVKEILIANVPSEALLDPNVFRQERLYTAEMEELVEQYWDLMWAIHKLYRARDRTKYFWIEHWSTFLTSCKLLGTDSVLGRREAKLIFAWSQLLVSDELRRRKRAVSLSFFDFIEALARVADLISPPSRSELETWYNGRKVAVDHKNVEELNASGGNLLHEWFKAVQAPSSSDLKPQPSVGHKSILKPRPSAGLISTPTRPLHEKFGMLMDYIAFEMKAAWGGKDLKDCANKMIKMTTMINGGVELG